MAEGFFTSENSAGSHKLYYQTWGDPSGRPMICVHGLTGSSQDFKYVGEFLSARGYYTIALDMPGRGRSDFLENPADYNFAQYFTDLRRFFAHLTLTKFDWLGVSMGGLLGIHIAGEDNSPVQRMILNDVGPEVPSEALAFISGYLAMSPVFASIDEMMGAMKQSRGTPFYRGDMSEEQWQHYARSHARKNQMGLWSRAFDPGIAYNFAIQPLGKENLWPYWDRITQPVLALRGELSTLFTEPIAAKMLERKIGAPIELVRFPEIGHVPSLYPEDQIRILFDWLQKTPVPAA